MQAPPNLGVGNAATNSKWWNNPLGDCYWSDQVWGNTVCTAEYLPSTPGHSRDPVLHGLMQIGVQDWHGMNWLGVGSLEVMRHATSMVAHMSGNVYLLEDNVPTHFLLSSERGLTSWAIDQTS